MHEIIANIHLHTIYSDGHASPSQIIDKAIDTGLDAIIFTDHNVLIKGLDGYWQKKDRKILVICGEEIHNRVSASPKNHLLVLFTKEEMSKHAKDPQHLIQMVKQNGGLSFIAHPFEDSMPSFKQEAISWIDWNVQGFTGIELWNGFSEFKSVTHGLLSALYYAFNPNSIVRNPNPKTIQKWNDLLNQGYRIAAIAGADAHAIPIKLGPFTKIIFPYERHFSWINNHLLLKEPLVGNFAQDSLQIKKALQHGSNFIANDGLAAAKGFRFFAQGHNKTVEIGDTISLLGGVTLTCTLPMAANLSLIHNGKKIHTYKNQERFTHVTNLPGIYRVEAYLDDGFRERGWIFSNPIYVVESKYNLI